MKLEQLKVGQRFEAIDLEGETLEVVEGGLLKIVEPEKGKYVPKVEETYWYVRSNGDVDYYRFANDKIDEYLINHQPVFRAEEEAYEYKDYLELLDKYKYEFSKEEWEDEETSKWFIECIYPDTRLVIVFNSYVKFPLQAYFKSQEDAEAFINEVGEESIKRFMFDVWE